MSNYKILWIDDEHEALDGFKTQARMEGIDLVSFKSKNEGLNEIKMNYNLYDGVLLDAKIFENENDVKGSEDVDHVFRLKEQLVSLPKKFEIFVLTGQKELFEDKSFHRAFKKVFRKGSDEDEDRLFSDIKEAADKQEDTQLRHKYHRVFEVCTEKYIGEAAAEDLLFLLKIKDNDIDSDKYLNKIRHVIEDLFKAFNTHRLLPTEFIEHGISLNESSKFLAGESEEKGYRHKDSTHLHSQVAHFLKSILFITQNASHRSPTEKYIKEIKTPFLYKSTLYQLLDVLVWFKIHIDSNPKTENWEKIETILYKGEIRQDENGNYYCGEFIFPYKKIHNILKEGEIVKIIREDLNNNIRTKHIYPKFAVDFGKLS